MSFKDLEDKFANLIRRFRGPAMNITGFLTELRAVATEAGLHLIQEIKAGRIIPPDPAPPWLEVIIKPDIVAQRLCRKHPSSTSTIADVDALLSQLFDIYSNACKRDKPDYGMAPSHACIFFEALSWLPWSYPLSKVHLPWVKVTFSDETEVYFVSDCHGDRGVAPACSTLFEIAQACLDACSILAGDAALEGEWSKPMSKAELMTRLNLKRDAFETFARHHELRKISRQSWQIRLDRMDKNTRNMIEHGHPL